MERRYVYIYLFVIFDLVEIYTRMKWDAPLCNISKSTPLKIFRIIIIVVAAMCLHFLSEKKILLKNITYVSGVQHYSSTFV